MGISGLLPLLKSIHKHCTLKKFAGQTIGIDAYGWLHRGTVACAIELALEKPTTRYVDFAMGRVRMLLDFGVTPYLVFDGDNLPSKAGTNKERRKRRNESKAAGLELYKAGKLAQAHQELQKAADVTPYMAREFIEALKKANVQYIVAPYEADAQLVFLEEKGIINGILSEDSDMLVFGAKRLITKLNQYGECVEIERSDFPLCKEISLTGWTDGMFRRMAILSGCDYLPNIDKMGLKTAYRYIRKYKDAEKIIKMVQFEGKLSVPADYLNRFQQAELTFLHHRVYCPIQQEMVFLHELPRGLKAEDMPYLGSHVEPSTATGVACGDLDPKTKEPFVMRTSTRSALAQPRQSTIASPADLQPNKSIDSFFKAYRQPLAELDPNSLTPSPSQQRLQAQYRNTSWAPRLVSSAPQLRRAATSVQASSTDRSAFSGRASAISTFQPPKRPRLCSESQDASPAREVRQSPFFASQAPSQSPLVQKKARNKKARRAEFDIWSEDSVDDVLLGLPDIQQTASPAKNEAFETIADQGAVESDLADPGAVPQSSPARGFDTPPSADAQDETSQGSQIEDNDIEPFEDLLESHIRMQQKSLLKSFAYQSPSKREEALRSLSPRQQIRDHSSTFAAQSPERQIAALVSLSTSPTIKSNSKRPSAAPPSSQSLDLPSSSTDDRRSGKTKSFGLGNESISAFDQSSETKTFVSYPTIKLSGSEDELAPNSEDGSEAEEPERRPTLNLKGYEYVPA